MLEKDVEKVLEALVGLYDLPNFNDIYVSAVRNLTAEDVDKLNELISQRIERLAAVRESIRIMRERT